MIDTPSTRERFLDARRLAAAGGVAVSLAVLALSAFLRVSESLDRATDDRVATALADAPVSPRLLVVRAPSRSGDWKIASVVARLDSAGARAVGVAIDLSVPVAPVGALPDLPAASPHAIIGVMTTGDSVAWPWFLADSLRVRRATHARVGFTTLLRDADGTVRMTMGSPSGESWLSDRLAALLADRPVTATGDRSTRLRFSNPATGWYGVHAMSLDSALVVPMPALRSIVTGSTVLLGIDDGSSVPTSVGALSPLAVLAHDVNARARAATGDARVPRDPAVWLVLCWLALWAVTGASAAALTSLRGTVLIAALGVVVQTLIVLWLIDATGLWLPLGTAMLSWLMAMAGAEIVQLWQARRKQHLTALLFSRFVTPQLAADAWSERHLYLQGGRPAPLQLPVTVLFVDLRGFTRFSEANSAADVMQLLTDVTAACAADIAAHGGLVDDFAGDGIKADFGVPVPRRDAREIAADAEQAVRCAQALATTIERLLPASIGTAGTQARIGVHSGVAVAGTIGGAMRMKYTVVGDVVNVAARLQSVELPDDATSAQRCRIVISAATLALLPATAFPMDALGALALSGRTEPVHAYRLVATPVPPS
jgi:class 3 adenylate cyclase/CHASE2 domain-containing sensor protein